MWTTAYFVGDAGSQPTHNDVRFTFYCCVKCVLSIYALGVGSNLWCYSLRPDAAVTFWIDTVFGTPFSLSLLCAVAFQWFGWVWPFVAVECNSCLLPFYSLCWLYQSMVDCQGTPIGWVQTMVWRVFGVVVPFVLRAPPVQLRAILGLSCHCFFLMV